MASPGQLARRMLDDARHLASRLQHRYSAAPHVGPAPSILCRASGPTAFQGQTMTTTIDSGQKLHLVFGGELENLEGINFRDVKGLDIVGIFPDYASAQSAWKSKAQATVDSAQTRYFIVHLHRLLEP
jgi:hypothetical protein